MEVCHAAEDLADEVGRVLLRVVALLSHPVQQLAARHQLGDNVDLALGDVHGVQLDAVGVVHLRAGCWGAGRWGPGPGRSVAARPCGAHTRALAPTPARRAPHLAQHLDFALQAVITRCVARLVHDLRGAGAAAARRGGTRRHTCSCGERPAAEARAAGALSPPGAAASWLLLPRTELPRCVSRPTLIATCSPVSLSRPRFTTAKPAARASDMVSGGRCSRPACPLPGS